MISAVTVLGGLSQPHGWTFGKSIKLWLSSIWRAAGDQILMRRKTAAALRLEQMIGQNVLLRQLPVRDDLCGIDVPVT